MCHKCYGFPGTFTLADAALIAALDEPTRAAVERYRRRAVAEAVTYIDNSTDNGLSPTVFDDAIEHATAEVRV